MNERIEIDNIEQLAEVTGGSMYETLNDGMRLRMMGFFDKSYPLGNSNLSAVAEEWAPEIEKIIASHGYRSVCHLGSDESNEYYDPDGNKMTRGEFWTVFR